MTIPSATPVYRKRLTLVVKANAITAGLLAIYFFLIPAGIIIHDISDPAIRGEGMPRAAIRLFHNLTPKYEAWARKRLASSRATQLSTRDVAGTEWPLFGSLFFLWGAESLQKAWDKDPSLMPVAPKEYARGAIDTAASLVIDPKHATWVKRHWGERYLERENVFYRMMVMGALTAHYNLTGDQKHLGMLREQVQGLSRELEESRHGLLDDYPGECYPSDVLVAIACIRRADKVLGTDQTDFVARARRGFEGTCLDRLGLVPYSADPYAGTANDSSRGCGNSYVSLFAPELWPEQAARWYSLYEEHFWQERWSAVGFREFPKSMPESDWYMDVDAGPVLAGHGIAACAFGVGASRVNGRYDHAYPLITEMIATSWPLAGGTLVNPRLLSNAIDAPYLGEACILYNLTREKAAGVPPRTGGSIPLFVYLVIASYLLVGALLIASSVRLVQRWQQELPGLHIPRPQLQVGLWLTAGVFCILLFVMGNALAGLFLYLVTRSLPLVKQTGAGSAPATTDPQPPESTTQP